MLRHVVYASLLHFGVETAGFYAARIPLHWTVRWAMVIGAFGNSSLFLMQAIFPVLDSPVPAEGLFPMIFRLYVFGRHLNDNLWIWGGGNHRLLVNIPPCPQR